MRASETKNRKKASFPALFSLASAPHFFPPTASRLLLLPRSLTLAGRAPKEKKPTSWAFSPLCSSAPSRKRSTLFMARKTPSAVARFPPCSVQFWRSAQGAMQFENLRVHDPFAEADTAGGDVAGKGSFVHIRIQQRSGRKTLTTVQVRFLLLPEPRDGPWRAAGPFFSSSGPSSQVLSERRLWPWSWRGRPGDSAVRRCGEPCCVGRCVSLSHDKLKTGTGGRSEPEKDSQVFQEGVLLQRNNCQGPMVFVFVWVFLVFLLTGFVRIPRWARWCRCRAIRDKTFSIS